jgi:hypothetical protein
MKANYLSTAGRLKNGEFLQLMKHTIEFCERGNAEGLKLDKRLFDLKSSVLDLEEVFQTPTAHALTPELLTIDDKRMNAMKALKKVLDSNKLISDEVDRTVRILTDNYDNHARKINRQSAAQKTATFDALYKDWNETPELTEAMNTLELGKWLGTLQKANAEFNDLYLKRVETTRQSGRITEKRVVIKSFFDDLIRDVEAHIRLSENSQPYQELLSRINTLLRNYKNLIKTSKQKTAEIVPMDIPSGI